MKPRSKNARSYGFVVAVRYGSDRYGTADAAIDALNNKFPFLPTALAQDEGGKRIFALWALTTISREEVFGSVGADLRKRFALAFGGVALVVEFDATPDLGTSWVKTVELLLRSEEAGSNVLSDTEVPG